MLDFIAEHLTQSLIVLGLGMLIIDVVLLGFATFVLTFVGAAMLITGSLIGLGILPADPMMALFSITILTALLAAGLWQPLKKLQNKNGQTRIDNDFAEHEFTLAEDVDRQGNSRYVYSGIQWRLKSEQPITKGSTVKVVRSEVGVLWVEEV